MNLSFLNLEFYPIPNPRRTDFDAHLMRRIIVCSENSASVDLVGLHGYYRQTKSGIPYHYAVMSSGAVVSCRPRYWQNDLTSDTDSFINNSSLILMEGLSDASWTEEQVEALAQLCLFLFRQDGTTASQVIQYPELIKSNKVFPSWSDFTDLITTKVTNFDPTRSSENASSTPGFGETIRMSIPGDIISNLQELSIYTGVPEDTILAMNPYLLDANNIVHDLQLMSLIVDGLGETQASKSDTYGVFGLGTQYALKSYQKANSLTMTGTFTSATRTSMLNAIAAQYPSWTNPAAAYASTSLYVLGSTGNGVAWMQYMTAKLGYKLTYPVPSTITVALPLSSGTVIVSTSSATESSNAKKELENWPSAISALTFNAKDYDVAYEVPIVKSSSSSDSSYVVRSTLYGGVDRPSFYDSLKLPGYKRATLNMKWMVSGKKPPDGVSDHTINFLVSPSSFTETRSNIRQLNRTNGGWFVAKGGRNPIQMNVSGYMMDIKNYMERHQFIWSYKRYIEDRKNNVLEFENYYSVKFTCEGREYYGYIDSIQFSKSSMQPFMYQYNINFVALDDRYVFQSDSALKEAKDVVPSSKATAATSGTLASIVYNATNT